MDVSEKEGPIENNVKTVIEENFTFDEIFKMFDANKKLVRFTYILLKLYSCLTTSQQAKSKLERF